MDEKYHTLEQMLLRNAPWSVPGSVVSCVVAHTCDAMVDTPSVAQDELSYKMDADIPYEYACGLIRGFDGILDDLEWANGGALYQRGHHIGDVCRYIALVEDYA